MEKLEKVKEKAGRLIEEVEGIEDNRGDEKHSEFVEKSLREHGCAMYLQCSSGGDRVGLIIALLQTALGIEREAILQTYEESCGSRSVLQSVLRFLDINYGSCEAYFASIGYECEKHENDQGLYVQAKRRLLKDERLHFLKNLEQRILNEEIQAYKKRRKLQKEEKNQ